MLYSDSRFREHTMKLTGYRLIGLLLLVLFVAGRTAAIEIDFSNDHSSVRCTGGSISVGEMARGVREKCGEPAAITPGNSHSYKVWIYRLGESKFMYYLGFLNGQLERIVSRPCVNNDPDCYDAR